MLQTDRHTHTGRKDRNETEGSYFSGYKKEKDRERE